jgi:osmotically inducible lipoprotein OsmB
MTKYITLAALVLSVAACGDTWGQRAVTGGGIGAGSGALLGVATGFNPLLGAVVGGAAGAGIGAATTPQR